DRVARPDPDPEATPARAPRMRQRVQPTLAEFSAHERQLRRAEAKTQLQQERARRSDDHRPRAAQTHSSAQRHDDRGVVEHSATVAELTTTTVFAPAAPDSARRTP